MKRFLVCLLLGASGLCLHGDFPEGNFDQAIAKYDGDTALRMRQFYAVEGGENPSVWFFVFNQYDSLKASDPERAEIFIGFLSAVWRYDPNLMWQKRIALAYELAYEERIGFAREPYSRDKLGVLATARYGRSTVELIVDLYDLRPSLLPAQWEEIFEAYDDLGYAEKFLVELREIWTQDPERAFESSITEAKARLDG